MYGFNWVLPPTQEHFICIETPPAIGEGSESFAFAVHSGQFARRVFTSHACHDTGQPF